MSDLGIICALFGYLLRLSDDADIMFGCNAPLGLRPSLCWALDIDLIYLERGLFKLC